MSVRAAPFLFSPLIPFARVESGCAVMIDVGLLVPRDGQLVTARAGCYDGTRKIPSLHETARKTRFLTCVDGRHGLSIDDLVPVVIFCSCIFIAVQQAASASWAAPKILGDYLLQIGPSTAALTRCMVWTVGRYLRYFPGRPRIRATRHANAFHIFASRLGLDLSPRCAVCWAMAFSPGLRLQLCRMPDLFDGAWLCRTWASPVLAPVNGLSCYVRWIIDNL